MKKIFIILSILLLIATIFLVAYNIAFKKEIPSSAKEELVTTVFSEKRGKIVPITEEAIKGDLFVDKENDKLFYYAKDSGSVFETDLDGRNKRTIFAQKISDLIDVSWSSRGDKAILKTLGGYSYFDYGTKKNIQLKSGLDTVSWSKAGDRIFYKYFDDISGQRSINISLPDGSDWKKLADVKFRDVAIFPFDGENAALFWNSGKSNEEISLNIVSLETLEVKNIFSGKFGADCKVSSDGKKILISHLKKQGENSLTTGIVNINGEYREIGVPTLASKMTWSSDGKYIYYALPSKIENSIMPDEYKSEKVKTLDTFWKINTENGEKTRIIELENITGSYDASNLVLTPSENALLFVNRNDEKVYRLDF